MQALRNYIIFKTDVLFNEKTKFTGVGGKQITFRPDFNPTMHVRIYGEVVSVPKELSKIPISQEHRGIPSYHEYSPFNYKYVSDIVKEVEVGDRIYFHFNTIMNMNNVLDEKEEDGKKVYYIKVRYDQVICAVRGDKVIMIGGYTLIDPDYETWEDILVTTYSKLKDRFGKPIPLPKDKWIQKKVEPGYKYLRGFVRNVGTPLKGDKCEIELSQCVYYRKNADWLVEVEGKKHFVIRQHHIIGRTDEYNHESTDPKLSKPDFMPDVPKIITSSG